MKKAILISCFNWYEKRLQVIREILINRGYEVVVLLSDFDHIKKLPIENRYVECTYLPTLPYHKNFSFTRIRSHLVFSKLLGRILEEQLPDLVYALVPPNSVAKQCLAYKKKYPKINYIVDIIDLWPESIPFIFLKNSFLSKMWANMRDESLREADGIVLECNLYHQCIPIGLKTSNVSTIRLYSTYQEEELLLAEEYNKRHCFDFDLKKISFVYIGSLNSITDYKGILDIVKFFLSKNWKVSCHIIGEGQNRVNFISELEATDCQVIYHGMIFDNFTKIKIASSCDFAFNMMTVHVAVGLTMKSLDYISIGLPMINNIKGDTWNIIDDYGIGLNYNNNEPELLWAKMENMDYTRMRGRVLEVLNTMFTRQVFEKQVSSMIDTILDKRR